MLDSIELHARLADVRDRIARAASRVHRDPHGIQLVAISKTFPQHAIRAAATAGQLHFGENKIQEALPKIEQTAELGLKWHLVGHLQSNKARKAARVFDVVHSVDDEPLVQKLDEGALEAGRVIDLLIQVDLAGESTKHGTPPAQLRRVIDRALACQHARLVGLMVLPPAVDDPNEARPYFAMLRRLRDELVVDGVPATALAELSMGMSHDFEVAVEEGATLVRVGSAIFGSRSTPLSP